MAKRSADRYCAIAGTRGIFVTDGPSAYEISSDRVRDMSERDCALELKHEIALPADTTGELRLELRSKKVVIRGATVRRCEGTTMAVSFEPRDDLRSFYGAEKTTGVYKGRPFRRKKELALVDIRTLSEAARQSSGLRAHLLIACLTLAGIIGALLPAMRSLEVSPGLQAAVALLPAWIATLCTVVTFQKGCFQNRANAFLTLLQQRLNEGSFPSGYRGWEDARANLCRCSYPCSCGEEESCFDCAWAKIRKVSRRVRLHAQPIVFSFLALATYAFIYLTSLILALFLLFGSRGSGLGTAPILGFLGAVLSILPAGLASYYAYHVLCGRYSTMTWHLVWERLLAKCSRYCAAELTRGIGGLP